MRDNDVSLKEKPNDLKKVEDDSVRLWFVNQLNGDACVAMAISNVLLNMEERS